MMLSKAVREDGMTKEQAVEGAVKMAKEAGRQIMVFMDTTEQTFEFASENAITFVFPKFKSEDLICVVGADGVVKY